MSTVLQPARPARVFTALAKPSVWLSTAWVSLILIASQLPYSLVWRGKFTYVYDAFTTFSPWNVARLADLRHGEGRLKLFQESFPGEIWPSYFFSNLVRQLAALVQPNSAIAHAQIQAIHALLLVPSTGLLFRSLGIPFRYGIVGGLVFGLSGIHVSVSQHVLAHEALLYLVLGLWGLRELLLLDRNARTSHVLLWASFSTVMLASLVRVHHEAMLYVIPVTMWIIAHMWLADARRGRACTYRNLISLVAIGVVILVASVPMLATAYEMSHTNKTLIQGYEDLHPYFPSARIFLLGLSLPGFTGSVVPALPSPFSFGQEATLSYVFAGSLSAALLATVVFDRIASRRWNEAFWLCFSLVVLVGYTYGAGSPIHRVLCHLFPFLVDIAHNYYGLHLLYLLSAYGVAAGLQLLAQGRRWPAFCVAQILVLALVMYFALRVQIDGGSSLVGSLQDFNSTLQGDSRWIAICSGLVLLAGATVMLVRHGRLRSLDRPTHAAMFVAVSLLVALDLMRPLLSSHFVPDVHFLPNATWVAWANDPLGGFRPSEPLVAYLRNHESAEQQRLRILPLYPKPGGWHANALLPLDNIRVLHMPADSGGNRAISQRLEATPDPALIQGLVRDFGVEAFWVSRWEMEPWAQALAQTSGLERVASAEYGGDIYLVRPEALHREPRRKGTGWALPWHGAGTTIEQGLVTRKWSFPTLPDAAPTGRLEPVELPLMWHTLFAIEQAGKRVSFSASEDGLLVAHDLDPNAGAVTVRYPTAAVSVLVVLSAIAYLAALSILAICLALRIAANAGWSSRATGTPPHGESEVSPAMDISRPTGGSTTEADASSKPGATSAGRPMVLPCRSSEGQAP